MTLQLHTVLLLHATQILSSPCICDLVPIILPIALFLSLQLRNLTPHRGPSCVNIFRVEHQDKRPA